MIYLKIRRFLVLVIILLISPLLIIIFLILSLVVAIDNKGKIIYKQKRIGQNEKEFHIYKFLTLNNSVETCRKISQVTKLGNFLRKHRLDELPQLINVLSGDLCLIGPRPEITEEYKLFKSAIPDYKIRKLIPQGITGWAQVNYPHSTTIEGNKIKLEYDLYYIRDLSPLLDLKILLKTVLFVWRGKP